MKKIIPLLFLFGFLFSSCTKNEKYLVTLLKEIKTLKVKVINFDDFSTLSNNNMIVLKKYSESIAKALDSLSILMKKKSSKKRIKKEFLKSKNRYLVCSQLFISSTTYNKIKKSCLDGPFEICPIAFSQYERNRLKAIHHLKIIIGNDRYTKTDCEKIIKREL